MRKPSSARSARSAPTRRPSRRASSRLRARVRRPAYSFSACVVEVEVDEHTGWITVPKIWIAHDIGRALNPVLARGQVIGGVYMGLGEALMEEQVFRRLPPKLSNALVHKIPSLLEYKSITSLDMPEVEVDADRGPRPELPVRRQGGRPGAAAAGDAGGRQCRVRRGRRAHRRSADHARKILRALQLKREGKNPRVGPEHFPRGALCRADVRHSAGEGGDGNESKKAGTKTGEQSCMERTAS